MKAHCREIRMCHWFCSEDEPFAADDGEEYNKEEDRVNGAAEEAVGEAANDNAVLVGVACLCGAEGVAHAGGSVGGAV